MKARILALTLWPEWAWAITFLDKRVENRTWKDDRVVGSFLAIHAGKSVGGAPRRTAAADSLEGLAEMAVRAGWEVPERHLEVKEPWIGVRSPGEGCVTPCGASWDLTRGAVVAVAKVTGFVAPGADGGPWHVPGQWGWKLGEVVRLGVPVPCRGRQGLWRLPPAELAQVRTEFGGGDRMDDEYLTGRARA